MRTADDFDRAPVLLRDLHGDGQSQARTTLALRYQRQKQRIGDFLGNPGAIIQHRNVQHHRVFDLIHQAIPRNSGTQGDFRRFGVVTIARAQHRLRCVLNDIEQ